jgi:hypothetical protein
MSFMLGCMLSELTASDFQRQLDACLSNTIQFSRSSHFNRHMTSSDDADYHKNRMQAAQNGTWLIEEGAQAQVWLDNCDDSDTDGGDDGAPWVEARVRRLAAIKFYLESQFRAHVLPEPVFVLFVQCLPWYAVIELESCHAFMLQKFCHLERRLHALERQQKHLH